MTGAVLHAKNLDVRRNGKLILESCSLEVHQGETLSIYGPNGAGKSTLLQATAWLLPPSGGSVLFRGRTVGREVPPLEYRRRIAAVFQEPVLLRGTVLRNLTLGMKLRGVPRRERRLRAERWLGRSGIAKLRGKDARHLSTGEAQRTSLARAMALEPEVLFLDEPFSSLDTQTRSAFLSDLVDILEETRTTTLLVTHDLREASLLSHRITLLSEGRIVQEGRLEEVLQAPASLEAARNLGIENLIDGMVRRQEEGLAHVEVGSLEMDAVSDLPVGTPVTVCLHAGEVSLSQAPPDAPESVRNHFPGQVDKVHVFGAIAMVHLNCGVPLVAAITRRSLQEMKLRPGEPVLANFKALSAHLIIRR